MQSAPRTGPIRHALMSAAQEREVLDGFAPEFPPSLFRGENQVFTRTEDMEHLLSRLTLTMSKPG
jgi:hypothetical protein